MALLIVSEAVCHVQDRGCERSGPALGCDQAIPAGSIGLVLARDRPRLVEIALAFTAWRGQCLSDVDVRLGTVPAFSQRLHVGFSSEHLTRRFLGHVSP